MWTAHFRNVRCFYKPKSIPLAPVTLLVGENSSGKSSFLALLRIILNLVRTDGEFSFNKEPFFLGAYDQIAHYRGGKAGRSSHFRIGLSASLEKTDVERFVFSKDTRLLKISWPLLCNITAKFKKKGSQAALSSLTFNADKYGFRITLTSKLLPKYYLWLPSHRAAVRYKGVPRRFFDHNIDLFSTLFRVLQHEVFSRGQKKKRPPLHWPEIDLLRAFWFAFTREFSAEPYAIAPVRTKPERTYNPADEVERPEGAHIPMLLARKFFTDQKAWLRLKNNLEQFGKDSGLFQSISLRTLGDSDSDPFQVMIKISGPKSNLIDVGYGVSQILPILVDFALSEKPRIYLLQQPEVHLHPRAQAELGTLLTSYAVAKKVPVIIETHSDYLVDRIRMEIKEGKKIKTDDVVLLYFERRKLDVQIHIVRFDSSGNVVKPPHQYRTFFQREEERFLGLR